ncbi:CCD40 protein, partial [Galbula dea]|nr:CCD40 protein [Galbula dea]
ELLDMEEPKTDRGSPSLPSGAPLQAFALSGELNSSAETESALQQFGQLTGEHGDQRQDEECQQHRDEEPELSRSGETVKDRKPVVLDPEHPLVLRFQATLKDLLTKEIEKVNLKLQELRPAAKQAKARVEEVGVTLYGEQQKLAQLQVELEKSNGRLAEVAAARQQVEGKVKELRHTTEKMHRIREEESKKVSAMQIQADHLALRLLCMQSMAQGVHHNLVLMKQSAKKVEAEKVQAEVEKKKQDLLLDRLTRRAYELQEEIALYEAQTLAQAENTKVIRQTVNEARMEVEAITMEKKRLMEHWKNTLAAVKQRDEAYNAAQELLSKYRHDLKSLEADIRDCKRLIRKEEEKNELLVTILSRCQKEASRTKKRIAQCLSRQEVAKVESSTYARILHETEQAISRTKRERAACQSELLSISKAIEKASRAKEQMENEIAAKLQDETVSSKATKHFSQLVAKLRRRKMDLEQHFSKVEKDMAQVTLDTTQTNCRLAVLQKTLGELEKEIKHVCELIRCRERDIAKSKAMINKKQAEISQHKKKVEMILSQQGGQGLRPLEIEINKLKKQIEECNSEMRTQQKSWLHQQKELVRLTQEQEEQVACLAALKKQIAILQQKKVRVENDIQQERKEQKEIERHMRNMSNELIKLNVLIHKKNQCLEELQCSSIIRENEYLRALKAEEKELVEMQEKLSQMSEEKKRLQNSLLEAKQENMLWQRKIQLVRETRAAVDFEMKHGETRALRAKIHRMKIRYGQLMKQQEKMIRAVEASVPQREAIAMRIEAQKKRDIQKNITRGKFQREIRELRRSIREMQKNTEECDKTNLELKSKIASLSAIFLEKQQAVCRLQAECDALDSETESLQNRKRWNLLQIVAYQTRQKRLQALKEGKYTPLCRTGEGRRKLKQKLLDRLRIINDVVHQVQQEHPEHRRALQWLSYCLESRLGSQKA